MQHTRKCVKREGKGFLCLQPPAHFSGTHSSGISPRNPMGYRNGTGGGANLKSRSGQFFAPAVTLILGLRGTPWIQLAPIQAGRRQPSCRRLPLDKGPASVRLPVPHRQLLEGARVGKMAAPARVRRRLWRMALLRSSLRDIIGL